jgi:para-aminobenzoate synthetase component 1
VTPLVTALVPPPDPVRACEQLAGLPYRLFLDSAARSARLGRYSFLMADPIAVVRKRCGDTGDPLLEIRRLLAPHAAAPIAGLPPFQGGAAGYLAYDWGRALERLPAPRYEDLSIPDVVLGVYDWVLAWDHTTSSAWLISTGLPETAGTSRAARAAERAAAVQQRLARSPESPGHASEEAGAGGARPERLGVGPQAVINDFESRSRTVLGTPAPSYSVSGGWWDSTLALRSTFTHAGYVEAVSRIREYIYAGDIFQTNVSQRFEAPLREAPWALYRRLRLSNPAPFAAFFEFPEATVLSASPERFLRADEHGQVETRPIKGTRPRGLGPEHDAALGQALIESDKDRAENLMIVDLMRNDLSRVCAPGSLRVPELFAREQYATVHHLVSTVVGALASGFDALDLLRAAFPPGSITGAPKVRAMEIIAELEAAQRGVYCGAIGYWSLTGALDMSVAIRTALAFGDRVYFGAGGAVVADSDPEQEYRETLDKARGMIDVLAAPATPSPLSMINAPWSC